jgi:hypothetical protein
LNLNTYEQTIAMEVVAPEEIPVTFEGMLKAEEDIDSSGTQLHLGCANCG